MYRMPYDAPALRFGLVWNLCLRRYPCIWYLSMSVGTNIKLIMCFDHTVGVFLFRSLCVFCSLERVLSTIKFVARLHAHGFILITTWLQV